MKFNLSVLAVFALANAGLGQLTCLKGDCRTGYGEAVFPSGAKYFGEFHNGRAHGLGTMYFPEGHRYSGYWKNQYREGQGRFTFASGDEYLGAFLNNQMEGKGVMTYANGNVYKGSWIANRPHGFGELSLVSGSRYTGFFVDGKFEGEGTMEYADGVLYTGMWKNGRRSGQGKLFFPNGHEQQGFWEDDQPVVQLAEKQPATDSVSLRNCNEMPCSSGPGKYMYQNGTSYIGQFQDGLPSGEGKVAYPSGDRYEGGWLNHQPQGKGTMFYASGRVIGAFWVAGKPVRLLFDRPGHGSPQPSYDTTAFQNPKVHAVVVGVAQYKHIRGLRYTDDDAYRMGIFLRSPEGGAVPANQLHLLIDEAASAKAILAALHKAADAAGESDMLIFYFSGHGRENAFLPVDYDGTNNLLYHERVREIIVSSRARHKIVIADACHAGGALAQRSSVVSALERYYTSLSNSHGGLALMLSSKGEEFSLEASGLRSGVYSHFLIKGASGEADKNADGVVTVREIHSFLFEKVHAYTAGTQSPLLLGAFDPNMPFGTVR
jgi:hypothetical protein